jgi:hypothetical protein
MAEAGQAHGDIRLGTTHMNLEPPILEQKLTTGRGEPQQ